MSTRTSIQDRYVPGGRCFGCGPGRTDGLALRSFAAADGSAVATWRASPAYEAVPGVLNGGVIGTLLDCHTGAALALAVYARDGRWPFLEGPPWATAEYTVTMRRPTPTTGDLQLHGIVTELDDGFAVVEARLDAAEATRATCRAVWKPVRARTPASA